jgi:1-deoxy-D-xylulose-5-phosphate reductoisomerase
MRRIAILGSTGSIGHSALEVIRHLPQEFKVVALATNSNVGALCRQIKEFSPEFACIKDKDAACDLKSKISLRRTKLFSGEEGLVEMVKTKRIDRVLLAISGSAALLPLMAALDSGKDIALANKEALVMAGPLIMGKANKNNAKIIPVDSEQSAIWQCFKGESNKKIKNIYLTASGGPLRLVSKKAMRRISREAVLKHPRWKMGEKITVDSATLMNKGLEVLEAIFLFNLAAKNIKILIHPEAVIHSMVEFIDGVVMAQLSVTDMRIPIQYALAYPERLPSGLAGINFYELREMHFQKPDFNKFPCLELAYRAASQMGCAPAVLNAANEVGVEAFLKRRLDFILIPKVIDKVLSRHRNIKRPGLEDILEADAWARSQAHKVISGLN